MLVYERLCADGWVCVCFRGKVQKEPSQLEKAILDCFAKIVSTINPADLFINPNQCKHSQLLALIFDKQSNYKYFTSKHMLSAFGFMTGICCDI